MAIDDTINSLPNVSDSGYNPVQVPVTPQGASNVDYISNIANQPLSNFTNRINSNVAAASNLMGPANPNDPTSQALGSRAQQMYQTNLNSVLNSGNAKGQNLKMQYQGMDINNRASVYSNAQSAAQLNYQQVAAQRGFAVQQEQMKRQILGEIFQGVATLASFGAMKAAMPSPSESTPSLTSDSSSGFNPSSVGSFGSSPIGGLTYNSPNFGTLGE